MTERAMAGETTPAASPAAQPAQGALVYRQSIWTRVTHWLWAICLFFLLLSGLQIFNAHQNLYIGQESGFEYDNAVLRVWAENTEEGPRGYTSVLGQRFDTTGFLGVSGTTERPEVRAFPAWATIPSYQDLATGRVVHFFTGWVFVAVMFVWFLASLFNGHLRRDIVPTGGDLRALPADIVDHATLRFKHRRGYNPIQKLVYFVVFALLFPLIVLTGLTMSPGMDAAWPWLLDLFGGRQTARTIHFSVMVVLVLFFVVHIVMVIAANPINEMRSMITGWYRTSPVPKAEGEKADG